MTGEEIAKFHRFVTDRLPEIRLAVVDARLKAWEDAIAARMAWSEKAARSRWTRWLSGLPVGGYTRQQAIETLRQRDEFGFPSVERLTFSRWQGVIDLCHAIETAYAHNLPLRLTASDVNALRSWLD